MKRFSKMLALGMALAFVFGMTVSAAESPVAGSVNTEVTAGTDSENIEVKAADSTVVDAASAAAENDTVAAALGSYKVKGVLGVWDITVSGKGSVTFKAPALQAKQKYVLLHFKNGNYKDVQVIAVNPLSGGEFTATLEDGSPYALVLVEDTSEDSTKKPDNTNNDQQTTESAAQETSPAVSPKTGETMPVTGIMAVICLAAAAFCAKKARYNG